MAIHNLFFLVYWKMEKTSTGDLLYLKTAEAFTQLTVLVKAGK